MNNPIDPTDSAVRSYNYASDVKPAVKLTAQWGHVAPCSDPDGFLCYPEDGKCSCGVYKHHVHCVCGGITQVG